MKENGNPIIICEKIYFKAKIIVDKGGYHKLASNNQSRKYNYHRHNMHDMHLSILIHDG